MQPFFFFPRAHPWQLKKSISEVHKKKIQNKRTQATQIQRHSWKRVQVAMYKSVACRLQPLRALLAPVSACLGNAAVSRQYSSEGDAGGCFGRCTNTVATTLRGGVAKEQKAPQGAFTDEAPPRGGKRGALSDNHQAVHLGTWLR